MKFKGVSRSCELISQFFIRWWWCIIIIIYYYPPLLILLLAVLLVVVVIKNQIKKKEETTQYKSLTRSIGKNAVVSYFIVVTSISNLLFFLHVHFTTAEKNMFVCVSSSIRKSTTMI